MKAEYIIRLAMGEDVPLDGMKKSDIYRVGGAILQVIAERWQHDDVALAEVIGEAEQSLARQRIALAD